MSAQECNDVDGEYYKTCKVEPEEEDLRSSQAITSSPGFSSNPDPAQEMERRMPSKNDIRYYFNMEQESEADQKWARAVYGLRLSFNIFTHKVFKEA
ncbi:hypothetical protein R1sor_009449 [Riccia sorocarpa]|uniref:Uncharacterized protein n=1 Tax=Riccia sorocarpa TaxID=122646 RepID=A0ABD3HV55_9MARC